MSNLRYDVQQFYNLEGSITIEEIKDGLLDYTIGAAVKQFEREAGKPPRLYYYTFKGDGFEVNKLNFVVTTSCKNFFYVSAPKDEIDNAITLVIDLNAHLNLTIDTIGDTSEDFMHNRKTARLLINF